MRRTLQRLPPRQRAALVRAIEVRARKLRLERGRRIRAAWWAAGIALACAAWMLWRPEAGATVAQATAIAPAAADTGAGQAATAQRPPPGARMASRPAPERSVKQRVKHRPDAGRPAGPPVPRDVPPAAAAASLRAELARQIAELAAAMRCSLPPGAPRRIPARLRIAAEGVLRDVQLFPAEPLPAPMAACLRDGIKTWRVRPLPEDASVLVVLALQPR